MKSKFIAIFALGLFTVAACSSNQDENGARAALGKTAEGPGDVVVNNTNSTISSNNPSVTCVAVPVPSTVDAYRPDLNNGVPTTGMITEVRMTVTGGSAPFTITGASTNYVSNTNHFTIRAAFTNDSTIADKNVTSNFPVTTGEGYTTNCTYSVTVRHQ